MSEQEYLRAADKVRKGYEEGLEKQQPTLELVLSDGTIYRTKARSFPSIVRSTRRRERSASLRRFRIPTIACGLDNSHESEL